MPWKNRETSCWWTGIHKNHLTITCACHADCVTLTWQWDIPTCSPSLHGVAGTEWPPCSGGQMPWRKDKDVSTWQQQGLFLVNTETHAHQNLAMEAVEGSRRFSAWSWRQLSTKDLPTQISVFSSASLCCTVCGVKLDNIYSSKGKLWFYGMHRRY